MPSARHPYHTVTRYCWSCHQTIPFLPLGVTWWEGALWYWDGYQCARW